MKYEPINDDFFAKKLPRGGFTIIEDGNHKYSIVVNKDSAQPPGEDESSAQLKARLEPIGDPRRPR